MKDPFYHEHDFANGKGSPEMKALWKKMNADIRLAKARRKKIKKNNHEN